MTPILLSYLSSFRVVLLTWPLVAGVLALPVIAWQYRRSGAWRWSRAITIYLFIFYLLSLVLFTLLPLPDDFAIYCATRNRPVHVIPFAFVYNLFYGSVWDRLQIVLNVLIFVPLGLYARTLMHLSPRRALWLGVGVSLLIEVTQFTALWGAAPCRYRVADIDDVLLNVFGTWLGILLARAIANREPAAH